MNECRWHYDGFFLRYFLYICIYITTVCTYLCVKLGDNLMYRFYLVQNHGIYSFIICCLENLAFFLLVASTVAIFDGQFLIRCWETIKQKYGAHFRWLLVVFFSFCFAIYILLLYNYH